MDNYGIDKVCEEKLNNLINSENFTVDEESKIRDKNGNFVVSLILLKKVCAFRGYNVAENHFLDRKKKLDDFLKCSEMKLEDFID